MIKLFNRTFLLTFLASAFLVACDKDNDEVDPQEEQDKLVASMKVELQENYADIVYANYLDAYNTAVALQEAIDALVQSPSESSLEAAKEAWLAAREPYGQTEAFRFAGGPIDDEDGPEGLLNAWPLDESYIDYVYDPNADELVYTGIINDLDTYPTLSKELLESLNESGGEENISVGYHAIEFLLWGQDLTAPAEKEPGMRPYTDFTTAENADRRKTYLTAVVDLLLEDLQEMVDEWNPQASGNFRETFLAMSADEAIKHILTGIGTLSKSELAGERIFTAYDNRDQEDEHSCFSDNTDRDIRLNAEGIANVINGTYTKVDGSAVSGTSFLELLSVVDGDFRNELGTQLANTVNAVDATASPFDFAISDDSTRPQVLDAVMQLRTLGDQIAEIGTKLGISVNTELPE
ncbi:peptidase m75, imelysin [Marinilongibacter aquaticus]|uniref:imelysin family protein n=1 Tax=Marinilongibacter aquaticus TaxID=2975157 RepID=UPI0021BD3348|nr:imelysin family protein [Marinilongibacter aquaticus]UBM57943.1 peptidase m75, imelysin [Marinilongibacter aquaticus]